MSALAIMLCAGCDETVELTGIAVLKDNISLPVGGEILIVTRTTPENANSQTFTFSSNNENVAKVSSTGIVTVTGVGTAVITVTNGSFSQAVNVTGILNDIVVEPDNVPLFTQIGQTVQLSAKSDPDVPVTFTWTSEDPSVAIVSTTGLVETTGEGTTKIIVSAGGVSKEVLIMLGIPLIEKSVGWWKFDDPDNLAKATIGTDLVFEKRADGQAQISPANGPTAGNKAAFVPIAAYMRCLHGIAANGADGAKRVNEFTVMFDVMVPNASVYHTLINASSSNTGDASLYLKSRGRVGITGGSSGDRNSPDGAVEDNKWYRFVFSVKCGKENGFYNFYWNGELLRENLNAMDIDDAVHTLDPARVLLFYDPLVSDGGNTSIDDNDIYVAEIAIWDRALTAAEVAIVGMFDVDSNE